MRRDVDRVRPCGVDVEVGDPRVERRELLPRACPVGAAVEALTGVRLQVDRGRPRRRKLEREDERVGREPVAAPTPRLAAVGAAERAGTVRARVHDTRLAGIDRDRRDRATVRPVNGPGRRIRSRRSRERQSRRRQQTRQDSTAHPAQFFRTNPVATRTGRRRATTE